jgi:hypothetical protein
LTEVGLVDEIGVVLDAMRVEFGVGRLVGLVACVWIESTVLLMSVLIVESVPSTTLTSQLSHNTITPSLHINPEHQLFSLVARSPSS